MIILLFYRVFQFFTLSQVGTGQIYYFKKFINLPRINLKSFYCIYITLMILTILLLKKNDFDHIFERKSVYILNVIFIVECV